MKSLFIYPHFSLSILFVQRIVGRRSADEIRAAEFDGREKVGSIPKNRFRSPRLKGKVVLLDFWTYGCINCIHIIPDLKETRSEISE